jgi:hypothetical protein
MVNAKREVLVISAIVLAFVIAASIAMWPSDPFKNPAYKICTPDGRSCTGTSE